MYNVIYAPKGYHGILGRRIQKEIQNDRAHRFQHKVKQFIKKSDDKNKIKPVCVRRWQQSRLLSFFLSKIEVWFINRWNWLREKKDNVGGNRGQRVGFVLLPAYDLLQLLLQVHMYSSIYASKILHSQLLNFPPSLSTTASIKHCTTCCRSTFIFTFFNSSAVTI